MDRTGSEGSLALQDAVGLHREIDKRGGSTHILSKPTGGERVWFRGSKHISAAA